MSHALIFANGEINDGPMVRRALQTARQPLIVAADGGARVAQHFNLNIDILVGDMDSLPPDDLDSLADAGTRILRHPPEKDATDLELSLHTVIDHDARWIRIIGGLGGRIDQTLANIYLLALPALDGRDVRMVAGAQEAYLLRPGPHTISGEQDDTISLIPLGGAVHGIRTDGLYYPLNDETLDFGPARGISNVLTDTRAHIHIGAGILLLVHTAGRA